MVYVRFEEILLVRREKRKFNSPYNLQNQIMIIFNLSNNRIMRPLYTTQPQSKNRKICEEMGA